MTILLGVTIGDNGIIGANCLIYYDILSNGSVKNHQSLIIQIELKSEKGQYMNENKPKGSTILNATKWSLLTQIITKVIPPLTSMILARIFAPEVFGVIATITMITSFADTFSESGFQKYIISKKYENEKELELDADVSFWTNFAISAFLWSIICIFSKPLCAVLGNPGIETGLIVACAQLPITSLSSIQSAFYQRNYNFRRFLVTISINTYNFSSYS